MNYMNPREALELVELRIKEDKISWGLAAKEYRELTGLSISDCYCITDYIRRTYGTNHTV